ncbi:uncharacterized protein LOC121055323 [Oryza brachyantha]|uniref:uncharacterized protein LOC121055323 n=1 Tax=Oryza brachyantha TaxID=4533 RepID=UPI001ADAFD44|nr:uncharacterized protein LOC121055323 [Oryza brachyantha]
MTGIRKTVGDDIARHRHLRRDMRSDHDAYKGALNIHPKEENNMIETPSPSLMKEKEEADASTLFEESFKGIRLICTGKINNPSRGVSIAKAQHNIYYLEAKQITSPIVVSFELRRPLTIGQLEAEQPILAKERNVGEPLRSDAPDQPQIEKYKKLQEYLTDENIELARQLKDSNLVMNQAVQATEKTLDSTKRGVSNSLIGTGRANARAVEVYSFTSKTTYFQWFMGFVMTCMFIMVVLLMRAT